MDTGFGARLRAQREARQLTLRAIAANTKIKESLLHGLESGDLSAWPKGIFRRAFVRDYARAIGLDPETVVREFLELNPDPVEQTPFGPGGAPLTEGDLVQVHAEPATRLQRLIIAARTAVPTLLNRGERPQRVETGPQTMSAETSDRVPPAPSPVEPISSTTERSPARVQRAVIATPADRSENHSLPAASTSISETGDPLIVTRDESRLSIDLSALAELCTRVALVADWEQFKRALADTRRILDAIGVMLWCREADTALLTPVASHGYPDAVVARLTRIDPREDNAIGQAFRSQAQCVVPAAGASSAAVAVPVLAPFGCVGVLAFEVREGREQDSAVTAAATIIAAQLAALLTPAAEPHAASA